MRSPSGSPAMAGPATPSPLRPGINAATFSGIPNGREQPTPRVRRGIATACAKAFAGLAGLPDTVKDRTVRIELRRTAKHESTERMHMSRVKAELTPLAANLRAWAASAADGLTSAEQDLPDQLSDRQQDCWLVPIAIAEDAGGHWPLRARQAAVRLLGESDADDVSVLLLAHCRDAFAGHDRISTDTLLHALVDRGDDSPWARWWGDDVKAGRTKGRLAAGPVSHALRHRADTTANRRENPRLIRDKIRRRLDPLPWPPSN